MRVVGFIESLASPGSGRSTGTEFVSGGHVNIVSRAWDKIVHGELLAESVEGRDIFGDSLASVDGVDWFIGNGVGSDGRASNNKTILPVYFDVNIASCTTFTIDWWIWWITPSSANEGIGRCTSTVIICSSNVDTVLSTSIEVLQGNLSGNPIIARCFDCLGSSSN